MEPALSAIDRLLALGGELTTRRKFDLAHMRVLLEALGDPQRRFPSVLIAGTNGKGSTAATLASILRAAGYRTGLYTSPHLERLNERIRVGDELIANADLARHFTNVEAAAQQLVADSSLPYPPSFFEAMTAVAFLAFAESRVDIAVLEVGIGGRLAATNVVDPILSILTDISLDHTEWLGGTIAEIAREKAGILRSGGLMVTLPQHPAANQVIGEVAVPLGVQAVSAVEYLPMRGTEAVPRNRYTLSLPEGILGGGSLEVDSPLAGSHQQRNLALAIAAAVALSHKRGFTIEKHAIEAGIRNTAWPGRLQLLHAPSRTQANAPVLLDAAHNPEGAWALRSALSALAVSGPTTLVFGCMADKAVDDLARILFTAVDAVVLTKAATGRAAEPERLAEAARQTGIAHRLIVPASKALEAALESTSREGLVVVAGSIALLGECMACLREWTE